MAYFFNGDNSQQLPNMYHSKKKTKQHIVTSVVEKLSLALPQLMNVRTSICCSQQDMRI